jgi:hypothetical protein
MVFLPLVVAHSNRLKQNFVTSSSTYGMKLSDHHLKMHFQVIYDVKHALHYNSLNRTLLGVSLLAAQVLAGIGMNGVNLGIGKRDLTEAEMRGFTDSLNQALNDIFTNVIQKPVEDALAGKLIET